jgi:hypothetical protein
MVATISVCQIRVVSGEGVDTNVGGGNTSSSQLQNKLDLQPFQIKLEYDDDIKEQDIGNTPSLSSMQRQSIDEMVILNSTQSYLSKCLSKSLPNFSYLMLYQFVRDYVVDSDDGGDAAGSTNRGDQAINHQHYSKIAMNGIIYFSPTGSNTGAKATSTITTRPDDVQVLLLQNLLGDNVTKYVDVLHANGMLNVVNATLLSIEGNEFPYRDGQIVEAGQEIPAPTTSGSGDGIITIPTVTTMDMDDDMMRRMTLMLCLLIPGAFLFLAAAVFCCRSAREINWIPTWRKAEHDLVWQTSQHVSHDEFERNKKRMDSTSSTDNNNDYRSTPAKHHRHFGSDAV